MSQAKREVGFISVPVADLARDVQRYLNNTLTPHNVTVTVHSTSLDNTDPSNPRLVIELSKVHT